MIKIKNLKKKYVKTILDSTTVKFKEKTIHLIVGLNGSGKSTLLDCIVGLKEIDAGLITIDNYEKNSKRYKEKIFYIPSDFYLPLFMSGREYLDFVLSRYPSADIELLNPLLQIFEMTNASKRLIETYSFGMKKKIQIIAGIAAKTDYLLGDEIFSGLDFETTLLLQEILERISKERGLVLVTHAKNIVDRFQDNIWLMENGNLVKFNGNLTELEKTIRSTEMIDEKIQIIQRCFDFGKTIL